MPEGNAMSGIDWLIPLVLFAAFLAVGIHSRRYGRSVAGFLAGNRCAGRYLLCVSHASSQVGVITLVWFFQQYYDAGFTSIWWGFLENPVMIVIALTGWVLYRFRETRALTLAQFLEARYSRGFRIFCGIVAFLSGVLNYAIFPAVTARVLIALCGLPPNFPLFGETISTFPVVMALLLASAVTFVYLGGQVTVMITDFLQGVVSNIAFLVVIAYLLASVGWWRMETVLLAQPAGKSLVDPLDIGAEQQFNIWYWLISAFVIMYTMKAWQGGAGYNAAALTPHESKMANVLEGWRWRVLLLVALVAPIAVRTFLEHPEFATRAADVNAALGAIDVKEYRAEQRVPLALSYMLPVGVRGLMVAALYCAYLAVDNSYLHSWGSILVQDVVMPIRQKLVGDRLMAPRLHLFLLKASVLAIAAFAFVFGLLYRPSQYVAMWAAITASVFVAGAGSVIIGGLYWRRGSTAAAWSAMITGIVLSLYGIFAKDTGARVWFESMTGSLLEPFGRFTLAIHHNGWLTGQVLGFIAALSSIAVYVSVSLLGRRVNFDLDRLLFRGRYRELLPPSERDFREESRDGSSGPPRWMRALGFTREYSRVDTWITWVTVSWPLFWTVVLLVGTAVALTGGISKETWTAFWHAYVWLIFGTGVVIVAWFSIGGFCDLARMYAHLNRYAADVRDDGTVRSEDDRR
ncbi:MAG: sodium:solute symporter [Phycisphaerae bacterium]|nr:sodium:solute symporter [Phycisphaerae bacterium]